MKVARAQIEVESQSSLKRVLVSEVIINNMEGHHMGDIKVAILFEASPGFGASKPANACSPMTWGPCRNPL